MAHSAIGSGETPADPIALDLVDIQRNVVRALPVDKACYYFIRITNPGGFREFLAALLADKAATRDPGDRSFPCFSINIGFTCAGLERLQVNQAIIDSFPQVFRDGMAARADQLGDAGPSAAPQYWDGWLGSADIHCVVCLSAAPASALGDLQTRLGLGQEPRWSGFEILHTESGEWLRDGDDRREHFGFRDGLGQPKVAVKWSPAAGDLVDARENLVAAGEFILGYYDEDKYRQPNPIDPAMARNGTYMVFRKLAQDVAGFRQFIKDHARSRDEAQRLRAQLVGRWPDGTPLVLAPDGPKEFQGSAETKNDFTYADDPDGIKCPFTAHIRRANPRDDEAPITANHRRILRRGIPYGSEYDEAKYGGRDDGVDRGMLFVCFNARIDLQFEFLQREWINKGDVFGHFSSVKDPIVGHNAGLTDDQFIRPGQLVPIYAMPSFVTLKGGDYFFMPGIDALKQLAAGGFTADPIGQAPAPPAINLAPMPPKRFDPARLVPILLKTGTTQYDAELNVHFVGTHKAIEEIFKDAETFSVDLTRRRMGEMIDGPSLIATAPSAERDAYISALRQVIRFDDINSTIVPLVSAATNELIAKHRAEGALDVVGDLAHVVPILVVQRYFGIPGQDNFSESFKAARYQRQTLENFPPEWQTEFDQWQADEKKSVGSYGIRIAMLQFWARSAFRNLFLNPFGDVALTRLSAASTGELSRHVEEAIKARKAQPAATPSTVLDRIVDAQRQGNAYWSADNRARNALVEMVVGGVETVSKAVAHVIDLLLEDPGRLMLAKKAADATDDGMLDKIVLEAMRLKPGAELLFRTAARDTMIGDHREALVQKGALVCLHLSAAGRDGRYFTDTDPSAFEPGRTPQNTLSFGLGAHTCFAAAMAKAETREMVKALIRLPKLRRAAGPSGQLAYESEWMPLAQSLMVRFEM